MLLDNMLSYIIIFILKKLKNSQGPFGTIVNKLFNAACLHKFYKQAAFKFKI